MPYRYCKDEKSPIKSGNSPLIVLSSKYLHIERVIIYI